MTKLTSIAIALTLLACGGKKDDKKPDPGTGSPPAGTGSAPAATGSAPAAGSGSAPAATGSATAAGSGSAASAGSAAGSGSGSAGQLVDPGIKFADLPGAWFAEAGKLEVIEGVNETKFPVDNAVFTFEYGLDDATLPTDPKEYAAVLEKSGVMPKVTKSEAQPNGHYYESADAFRYVIKAGDKRIHCGGSLYKGGDYEKITKVRDKVIGEAKKLCASAKL